MRNYRRYVAPAHSWKRSPLRASPGQAHLSHVSWKHSPSAYEEFSCGLAGIPCVPVDELSCTSLSNRSTREAFASFFSPRALRCSRRIRVVDGSARRASADVADLSVRRRTIVAAACAEIGAANCTAIRTAGPTVSTSTAAAADREAREAPRKAATEKAPPPHDPPAPRSKPVLASVIRSRPRARRGVRIVTTHSMY